jgi:exopolyphosphatase/guanosine-5'-triphosphate,3'-diphosphate pyrophosphatase
LTGGVSELLGETALAIDGTTLTLKVPPRGSLYSGEAVQRRLDALGRAVGCRTAIVTLQARRTRPA